VFTPEQVVIEDTWTVSGLSGTGSHHFHVEGVVVPAERTCRPLDDEPCLDDPVARVPPPALFSLAIASVALGTAQGALDDIVAIAAGKVPLLAGAPLATQPLFQFELAAADTELRAARALLYETAASMWATAVEGGDVTLEARARARAAAVWTTARATDVVDTAYRCGGGTSVYADCPLQRRQRDVHVMTQHFLVRRDALVTAGAVLAGQEIDVPVF
jgi:alkylation response protein AidB-like acyl-CoA dehydrogenase